MTAQPGTGLEGRTALVCASTSGLGEASARALASSGARVAVCGRRGARAEEIAAELPGAVGLEADLTAPGGPARLVDAAVRAFGAVEIVVLNGPGPPPGSAAGMSADDLSAALDQLVACHREIVSRVLPGMRARGWGRIVAIGSLSIREPIAHLAMSNVGRAALAAYLKSLAAEVAADGVTVNVVSPGRIATARIAELDAAKAEREGRSTDDVVRESEARIPMGRYGSPEEFAHAVSFLCSEGASYITGSHLRCDGGQSASL